MNLKIIYRSTTIWNFIFFVLLSYLFLYVQDCIFFGKSAIDFNQLKDFVRSSRWMLGSAFMVAFLAFNIKKLTKWLFLVFVLAITSIIIQNLFQDFNKFILTMLFVFLIFSYYFFVALALELAKASLNPNFEKDELFEPMLHKLDVIIESGELKIEGYLTNWDESSCFVVFSQEAQLNSNTSIELELNYDGHRFHQSGKISTVIYNKGIGINFLNSQKEKVSGWSEYFDRISDLGYKMEHLK